MQLPGTQHSEGTVDVDYIAPAHGSKQMWPLGALIQEMKGLRNVQNLMNIFMELFKSEN